jgi:hypothetical protein
MNESANATTSSGKVFEGRYLDAYGYRGRLKIELDEKDNALSGRFELVIATEDKPQTISGPIEGKRDGANVRLALKMGKKENSKAQLDYVAEMGNAGSYAKQCLFGSVRAPENSGLGGGVWIAWQFAGPRPKGGGCCCHE